MEAKGVKTPKKTEFGKKLGKSAISWHYFERLKVRLKRVFLGTFSAQNQGLATL